jgi:hypothetical protein
VFPARAQPADTPRHCKNPERLESLRARPVEIRRTDQSAIPPWLWFNLLSLDAPLVAVFWQALFAREMSAPIHLAAFVALGLSVWFIYVSDRLLDALHQRGCRATRHRFYQRNWTIFSAGAIVVLFALGIVCGRLHPLVLRNGLLLLAAILAYFILVHFVSESARRVWPKELAVALLFAIGTALATWSRIEVSRSLMILPTILFATLCWLNCTAVEYWEWKDDRYGNSPPPHPVTLWLGCNLHTISFGMVLCGTAGFCWLPARMQPILGASLVSAATLFWLDRNRERFSADTQRVLVDLTLLSPALFMLAKPPS